MKMAVLCLPLLLGACGTKQAVVGDKNSTASSSVSSATRPTIGQGQQSEAIQKLTFVQKVSDNKVYSKNITGSLDFTIQMGSKNISVPGNLKMRSSASSCRHRSWALRSDAWSLRPSTCSLSTGYTRNISRQTTTKWISFGNKGSTFTLCKLFSGTNSYCLELKRWLSLI